MNENFNSLKLRYIDLSYPTKNMVAEEEEREVKEQAFETLGGDSAQSEVGKRNEGIFVENLRFRIDARVVKNLKD